MQQHKQRRGAASDRSSAQAGGIDRSRHALAPWQITLLVVAGAVVLIGGGLWAYSMIGGGEASVAAGESSTGVNGDVARGFAPEEGAGTESPEQDTTDDPFALDNFSPALFRLGFSFFVGFAIAYALRSFLKITLIAIGLLLIGLFGLQYAGVISVDWTAMQQHYETAMQWMKEQTAGFASFVQGYLPSAASAAGGFFVGFRRRT